MPNETMAMDHWMVCPADLYRRLKDELAPIAGSRLFDLRLDCGAVECVGSLHELRPRIDALLLQDVPRIRIVLPRLGRAEFEALGDFDPAPASRLNLYDFSADCEDVLGSLCTPEDAVAASLESTGSVWQPAAMAGDKVDDSVLQRYGDALLQWQQSLGGAADDDDDDDDDEAGGAPPFDWSALRLSPKLLLASPANVAQPGLVNVFAGGQPQPRSEEIELRWNAEVTGVDGIAIEVELVLPRQPDADGEVMRLSVRLAGALAPGPRRLVLDLGNGGWVWTLDELRWRAADGEAAGWVVRRSEAIGPLERRMLDDRRTLGLRLSATGFD